jgi:formylglycine-generating enzyme required for sulfatase activity
MQKILRKLWNKRYFLLAFIIGSIFILGVKWSADYTSTNSFCESCHVHPQATATWKQGPHFDNESGVAVGCVQCHLPPGGAEYMIEKVKTGVRDVYGTWFKDPSKINWEEKSQREHAVRFVYEASCRHCHQNLFPRGLSKKGVDAHLHYDQHGGQVRCINCHLNTGHYRPKPVELTAKENDKTSIERIIYTKSARVDSFVNFTETIPGTSVSFDMIAIPGGSFVLGSPDGEPYSKPDEKPQRTIKVSSFWMGKTEVSWEEYEAFYTRTAAARKPENQIKRRNAISELDAITGPTPAYGNPDQGWGKGRRPAITMTHFAARKYSEWLSQATGKKYRLPTEAEWEYACRAQAEGAYFFGGNPEDYHHERFLNRIFGADTAVNAYVIFAANSRGRTQLPSAVKPNAFGLLHALGNVKEFCLDWYAPEAYASYSEDETILNPKGPETGTEHVIRGGSFKSDAAEIRIANRDHTRTEAWLTTDPQNPKSAWWYSDCIDVGFRVVCEMVE